MTSESDMNSSATYHADTQTLQVLPPISAAQKKEPKKKFYIHTTKWTLISRTVS